MSLMLRENWFKLSAKAKQKYLERLSEEEAEQFRFCWHIWARDNQLEPAGDWVGWLLLAGRGFGKTRTAAEWIRARVETGQYGRVGIVARTSDDLRDVVIDGESGLLSIYPKNERPDYQATRGRVVFSNGSIAQLYSAREPDSLRGPQHHLMWFDEPAAYQYPDEVFDQAMFGLRLGKHPQWVGTTTPRPIRLIKRLVSDPTVAITRGSTYDNKANLAPTFINTILSQYEGTRLGRQEIAGEILDDNPNALWNRRIIDEFRTFTPPDFSRIIVSVDPAVSSNAKSNDTGIVVVARGIDGDFYVLDDNTLSGSPTEWGGQAVSSFVKYKANMVVGEVNQGGDLVESNVRACAGNMIVPFSSVHASRGKAVRAEPISTLYERGVVHHVGSFSHLEDELCNWDPTLNESSPDRLDALVWGLTWLLENGGGVPIEYRSISRKEMEQRRQRLSEKPTRTQRYNRFLGH